MTWLYLEILNRRVGNNHVQQETCLGIVGITSEEQNNNRENVNNLCLEHDLIIANTFFLSTNRVNSKPDVGETTLAKHSR